MRLVTTALSVALLAAPAFAQDAHDYVAERVDAREDMAVDTAEKLWNWAEVGYQETQSTDLLQSRLESEGFEIEEGVAGIPTAFIGEWGEGGPVIAILAEMDALPGISQSASPTREIVEGKHAGQACGHHLFGSASVTAALAVRDWLEETGTPGRIRVYGTPAEEGGSGKVYMARAGLFGDVDTVLHWHPSDQNKANPGSNLSNRSGRFTFTGVSSHAAAAPEKGRSALDGVEAMNMMVNMLREHVTQETRIHYVITEGGEAPNVVPDSAQVYYYVRNPEVDGLEAVWARVLKAAEGAATGTGTEVDVEVMHGNRPLLANESLQKRMHENLQEVGGVEYDAEELAFAEKIRESLDSPEIELGSQEEVYPYEMEQSYGSTDVGDVSWVAPTAGLRTATWVPGTSAHSWQAIAAGGMSIGHKGMINAAKVLAMTATDLYTDEALLQSAKDEYQSLIGPDFEYYALLGDREPPLDYRK
ncbi:amidohydrolase [Euryhalocaulis caribicus]|uniref:amidohydrolase n=1 Tax=Euryhalocaulis caribicus TaxID=1161401 RepID=UPI0003A5AEFC|nr:amidohydrolase [Euryhalocaulis caribicus]